MKTSNILLFLTLTIMVSSCVTTKKYEDLKARCERENTRLSGQVNDLQTRVNEQEAMIDKLKKQRGILSEDTTRLGTDYRQTRQELSSLQNRYKSLKQTHEKLIEGSKAETRKLLTDLQKTQEDLQKREDALKQLSNELGGREEELLLLSEKLQTKEQRLNELQQILDSKDSAVNALRTKVTDALLGFRDEGLSINVKNGKVYVSLEEDLLFRSGSYQVSSKGREAIVELAKVLEKNPDINVLIEGHTDDVPYNGSGQLKDNWDLSVMRATAIVKIIVWNSEVDPKRLTAAGRSKYVPVEDEKTTEARRKNRRTEIILTPKLDELFRIIESN